MAITNVGTTRLVGSAYAAPAGAFRDFGLATSSSNALDSQGIDDIVATSMLDTVYSFAQTKSASLPQLCGMSKEIKGGFLTYHRAGNVDWAVKSKAAADTPHAKIDFDERAVAVTLLDQGILIDMDMQDRASLQIGPQFQAKLTYALARNMDKLCQIAMTQQVPRWGMSTSATYQGARTVTLDSFDDDNRIVRTTGASTPAVAEIYDETSGNKSGTQFFDDLVNLAEEANVPAHDLLIIGSPELRRQLKRLDDFRDMENTISYHGDENLQVITWLGLNFLFLRRDAYYNGKEELEGDHYDKDGAIKASSVSSGAGKTTTFASDLSSVALETFLAIDMSSMVRGIPSGSNYARVGKRMDQSDAQELYFKAGVAFGRMDETKVWQGVYKSAK